MKDSCVQYQDLNFSFLWVKLIYSIDDAAVFMVVYSKIEFCYFKLYNALNKFIGKI